MKTLLYLSLAAPAALLGLDAALESTPSAAAPAPIEGGSATGKFTWDGDLPEPLAALSIDEEKSKGCCPDGVTMDTTNRSLLLDRETKGIANVVVVLTAKGREMEVKVREEPYVLDQNKCHFEPHVLVVPVGGTVRYHNGDEVNHNVHTTSKKNAAFNINVAAGGHDDRKMEFVETIDVVCDIHPWMSSYVFVTDGQYFGVTGADGTINLDGIAPGDYKVEYWHEKLGKGDLDDLTVEEGKKAEFAKALKEGGSGGGRRRR